MAKDELVKTGVSGLDAILGGGLPAHYCYLIEGAPGTGKTTLALQFLLAGAARGERVMYVGTSESERELREATGAHGWQHVEGVTFVDLAHGEEIDTPSIFHPSETELPALIARIFQAVEAAKPQRLVLDSISEVRMSAETALMSRHTALALKHFFEARGITALFLDEVTRDSDVETLVHGVIALERWVPAYGPTRRHLQVIKLRGSAHAGGFHDMVIRAGGVVVFPPLDLAPEGLGPALTGTPVESGIAELDQLLGGALRSGIAALLTGPAGSGKSSLLAQYAFVQAERGQRSLLFLFDETTSTFLERSRGLGLDLRAHLEAGRVQIRSINAAELTPGQFVDEVRRQVEARRPRIVGVDSLNGYFLSMPEERFLALHLYELASYLRQQGVLALLTLARRLEADAGPALVDLSHVTDVVMLLRYFEARGEVHKAISVLKNRIAAHEQTVRELRLTAEGIVIGEPVRQFEGVLVGRPHFVGQGRTSPAGEEPPESERRHPRPS